MKELSYKEIIKAIGKSVDSNEFETILKNFGAKAPKLHSEQGEYESELYFPLPKNGLNLILSLPDDVEPAKGTENLLTLKCIQFFSKSPANGITHSFQGELPFGITFNDLQKDVHKKAGKPSKSKKQLRLDLWDTKNPKFSVEYKKEDLTVEMLAFEN